MATTMSKGTNRGNAAVSGTNQYLKKGGKVKKYATGGTSPSDSTATKRMAAIGMVPDPSKPGLYMKDTKKTMVSKKMGGKASSKKMYGGMKKGGTKKGM
jgi:hypothetical protein